MTSWWTTTSTTSGNGTTTTTYYFTPQPYRSDRELAALELLRQAAGWDSGPDWDDPDHIRQAYRAAVKRHHPDRGGDPDTFRAITAARDLLLG